MDSRQRLADLERRAEEGGGTQRVDRQHAAGKLTAGMLERLEKLLEGFSAQGEASHGQ